MCVYMYTAREAWKKVIELLDELPTAYLPTLPQRREKLFKFFSTATNSSSSSRRMRLAKKFLLQKYSFSILRNCVRRRAVTIGRQSEWMKKGLFRHDTLRTRGRRNTIEKDEKRVGENYVYHMSLSCWRDTYFISPRKMSLFWHLSDIDNHETRRRNFLTIDFFVTWFIFHKREAIYLYLFSQNWLFPAKHYLGLLNIYSHLVLLADKGEESDIRWNKNKKELVFSANRAK